MIFDYIIKYLNELLVLTNAMAPYLLLGFLFAGILHVFFKKERVSKLLGSKKMRSTVYASLIGVPLPLCSCGVIPTGISFYKNGASKGSTVSFLISTPQTGVDSIMATYSMLGLPFAILRPFIAFVSGIFGGAFTNYIDKTVEPEVETANNSQNGNEKYSNPIKRMLHYAFVEFMQDIAKWLIIGLLLAALISLLLPPEFFSEYISNDFLSMLIILVASIPLYVCATGSIPIAAVLIMKGISPGAALVFLMAGPATNAATITVLGKVMGRKSLISYLVSIIGMSLLFGFIIDHFLPREWFTSFLVHSVGHEGHGGFNWFELVSTIMLVGLIANIYIQKLIRKSQSKNIGAETFSIEKSNDSDIEHVIKVSGVDCNHCKANVEEGIGKLEGIDFVQANINNSTVKIKTANFNPALIKETVESLGYNYQGEINKPKFQFTVMKKYTIKVKGMTCSHCKANVEKALNNISGVSKAEVDLDQSIVIIEGDNVDFDEVKNQINGIGYEYGGNVS
jgi:copper ion binding protein